MAKQTCANASTLVGRTHVCMADQVDIPHRLDAHHPDQNVVDFISPGCDACRHFGFKLAERHVRLMPTIVRYHPAVSVGRGVDDLQDDRAFVRTTEANLGHGGCLTRSADRGELHRLKG
jgi:hypothetical protein